MDFSTVASLDVVRRGLAGIVAHNPVPEGQSYGAEGSNSAEEQKSGTEVQKFHWKLDEQNSEWIRKLELGLDTPACYDEGDRVVVMKLPDFMRKPEEHYNPVQWRFGLHNRDLQTSRTVAPTTESEGLKISLAAACNLKSDRRDKVCDKKPHEVSENRRDEACDNGWNEFCDNVVHNLDDMVLKSYGLHPSNTTNFSKKEVQSLLTLDALTLLLLLSSVPSPSPPSPPSGHSPRYREEILSNYFINLLERGGLKIKALLKPGVAYIGLGKDLFLFENQIPMDLLKKVISKSHLLLKGQNSHSDIFQELNHPQSSLEKKFLHNIFQELNHPQSSLGKKFLHNILRNLVCAMCLQIFVTPCSEKETLSGLIDANYPEGGLEDCAHIFACVYEILTTVHSKEESSTTTKSLPDEDKTKGVVKESSPATKESARHREQLPCSTRFGNSPTVRDIRETSPIDSEQPGDCELQMSTIPKTEFMAHQRIAMCERTPSIAMCQRRPSIWNEPGGNRENGPETVAFQNLCCPQTRTVKKENLGKETLGSATDLKKAGLRIKAIPGMIKAVAFKKGCLSLPIFRLTDHTESILRNLAMYEAYGHHAENRRHAENRQGFLDYLKLMLQLIKTQEDVAYLIDDCKVIENMLITHQTAFKMWERLQRGIELRPYSENYKTKIVIPVNKHCASTLNKMRTEFCHRFCSKPWLVISVISAFVLLLATLIQTYVAVIGSDKMQPHFPRGG
ncbi:unnamed protein product [Sphagnum balticum]